MSQAFWLVVSLGDPAPNRLAPSPDLGPSPQQMSQSPRAQARGRHTRLERTTSSQVDTVLGFMHSLTVTTYIYLYIYNRYLYLYTFKLHNHIQNRRVAETTALLGGSQVSELMESGSLGWQVTAAAMGQRGPSRSPAAEWSLTGDTHSLAEPQGRRGIRSGWAGATGRGGGSVALTPALTGGVRPRAQGTCRGKTLLLWGPEEFRRPRAGPT